MSSSQATRLEDSVKQVATMLKEIHVWFIENLKDAPSTPQPLASGNRNLDQSSPLDAAHFQLYTETDQGLKLICSHAWLHSKWNDKHPGAVESGSTAQKQLFVCQCSGADGVTHYARVAAYGREFEAPPLRISPNLLGRDTLTRNLVM